VGWGVRGTWTPRHWPLAVPPVATSYFRDVLARLSKLSPGQMAVPWALAGCRSVFSPASLRSRGIGSRAQSQDEAGDHRAVFVFKPPIWACEGAEGARRAASTTTVGVSASWAPCQPSISCGLHSALLLIATLASAGRFPALVFSSPLLHPWNIGNALPETCLRRGGPLDVVCSSKGEGGVSPFPPIAAACFLLTFVLVQGYVRREPGPGVGVTLGMP
jgi:hypothetical protein